LGIGLSPFEWLAGRAFLLRHSSFAQILTGASIAIRRKISPVEFLLNIGKSTTIEILLPLANYN